MTASIRPGAAARPGDGGSPGAAGRAEGAADQVAEARRSARSGVAGLAGAAVNGLFGFLLAVVITRGYGTVGSGEFFTLVGVVTVAAAVCTLGAETGLVWALPRRRTGGRGDAARVLAVALLPPLVAALVVGVAGLLAADALAPRLLDGPADDGAVLIAVSFAAVPLVVTMTLLLAALRCLRPMRVYVGVQSVLVPLARPALVGAAVLAGGGVLAGLAGWLVPAALTIVVSLVLVVGPLGVGRGAALRPERADWSTFWAFALPRAASAAIDASAVWVGVLLTSVLAGQADAGVFGAVGRYVLAGQLAMQGLRVAVSPQLSRLLGRGDRAAAAAVHRQLTTWALVLSWPVYLLLAVFGLAFLQLFGPEFTAGATAMTVLALAMVLNTGVGNVQSLLLMSGRSGLHLCATVANLLVTVSLGLWLIPEHRVTGAAVAWAVGIATENLMAAGFTRAVVGERLVDRGQLRAAVVTIAAVGLAASVGVLTAGRGIPGLVVALAVLTVGCVGMLTMPRVRRRIRATMGQIRGRQGASDDAGAAEATKGR